MEERTLSLQVIKMGDVMDYPLTILTYPPKTMTSGNERDRLFESVAVVSVGC